MNFGKKLAAANPVKAASSFGGGDWGAGNLAEAIAKGAGKVTGGGSGGSLGAQLGKGWGDAKQNYWDQTGAKWFGDKENVGMMGTGQFKAKPLDINAQAFTDTKASDARQAEFAKALAASQGQVAPQMIAASAGRANQAGMTQLSPAAQVQAAQLAAAQQAQSARINMAPQAEFRAREASLASQLEAQAAGFGPSLAQSQLRQGTDRNIAQAMALQASSRGMTAGQGLRSLGQQTAMANQQAAQQAADLRMQEQMAARQQLAGVLGQARQADIGLATSQAGLEQQTALANQQATNEFALQQGAMQQQANLANQDASNQFALQQGAMNQQTNLFNTEAQNDFKLQNAQFQQQTGMANLDATLNQSQLNNDMAKFYQTGLLEMDMQEQERLMALEKLKVEQNIGVNQINASAFADAAGRRGSTMSSVGGALAGAAMMSDQTLKKDIKEGEGRTKKFLEAFSLSMKKNSETSDHKGHSQLGGAIGMGLSSLLGMGGSSGGAAGGAAAAASDRRGKKNVDPGDDKLKAFLGALKAYEYNYKNPEHGEGLHISPMAQDLEKTELGKSLVVDTPEGKMVNYAKAGGLMLATSAMLNDRMNDIEARLGAALKKRRRA